MTDLNFKKEYNNASSNKNNMDILQYGFKYNEFHGLYEIHFMTTGKRVTGLTTHEKMEKVLHKELEYQTELFRKVKRI